jgi:hypothetical protein
MSLSDRERGEGFRLISTIAVVVGSTLANERAEVVQQTTPSTTESRHTFLGE